MITETREKNKTQAQDCACVPDPKPKRKSATETAEALGVSTRKIEQVRHVADHATPEQKEAML